MATETKPPYQAACPKCDGSGRRKYMGKYASVTYGYDAADGTIPCNNCGGQYMSGRSTGRTLVDPLTGLGCMHSYTERNAGRCLSRHDCAKCGDSFTIDSSD